MSREAPAPFCERPGVKLLRPTRHAFETAKTELGLDHNETRSFHGWHRHVSLVMLAFAMLVVVRHRAETMTPPQKNAPVLRHQRWCAGLVRNSGGLLAD